MITISKELGEFWIRDKWWLKGYPIRFRKGADRKVFEPIRWVLLKPNGAIKNKLGHRCWQVADATTGAFMFNSSTRESARQFFRKIQPHWSLYRLILACRIDRANTVGPDKWGTTRVESLYTDEFNALLVAAKMEGLTHESTLKDITDAISNTTTTAV